MHIPVEAGGNHPLVSAFGISACVSDGGETVRPEDNFMDLVLSLCLIEQGFSSSAVLSVLG